ncbi:MAG: YihY/virulence factor BrkB family protein [Bacteroidetes bacterium]|nr:YihY/virulence factor BrkB family protein [Bacteroidota bacterium]
MPNFVTLFKKLWEFLSENIWHIRISKINKRQGIFLKQLRIFTLAVKGFNEDNCFSKASALTYYTLFSIVPTFALIFAIAKGFGYDQTIKQEITQKYANYTSILNEVFVYADSMLSNAKGGIIAGFGVVLLLWGVMKLLVSIETSFNEIWEIKKGRSWIRKITEYLTIMLISPVFLMISGAITVSIQAKIENIPHFNIGGVILLHLLAYFMLCCIFTFLYMALPNTKVNFKSAFVAGIIATILFEILQWAYIRFQIGASSLNKIYGGFAALPLFLIWLQYSWYVVLFGAEIAFANQNVDHYELENEIKNVSVRYKKAIALMIANIVAKEFYSSNPPLNAMQIAEKLDLPIRLARNIINEFVETGVFVELHSENKQIAYQPGVTESKFTVRFVFDSVELKGVNEMPISDTLEYIRIKQIMEEFSKTLDNELGNMLVKDAV